MLHKIGKFSAKTRCLVAKETRNSPSVARLTGNVAVLPILPTTRRPARLWEGVAPAGVSLQLVCCVFFTVCDLVSSFFLPMSYYM